jgi:hypothetical protein
MKNWIVNNFGIPKIKFSLFGKEFEFGPYYPFKKDPRSEKDEGEPEKPKLDSQAANAAAAMGGVVPPLTPPADAGGGEEHTPEPPKKAADAGGEEHTPEPTTPTPTGGSDQQPKTPKTVEKIDGTSLKLVTGVSYDPISQKFNYKGITFEADNQKELDLKVSAINKGSIIQYPDTGGSIITFNGATGQQSLTSPEEGGTATGATTSATLNLSTTPASEPSVDGSKQSGGSSISPTPETSSTSSGGDVAEGNVSIPSGGGEGTEMAAPSASGTSASATPPTEEGVPGPISGYGVQSGADLAAESQKIAEEHRMEASADIGSMINAPTTNSSQSSIGEVPTKLPDVYDNTLALMLVRA